MFLPEADRAEVWEQFSKNPRAAMMEFSRGGDQRVLEHHYLARAQRWQDVLPGQVVSYKAHCCQNVLGKGPVYRSTPEGTRIIAFHGTPRPWYTEQFKDLYYT